MMLARPVQPRSVSPPPHRERAHTVDLADITLQLCYSYAHHRHRFLYDLRAVSARSALAWLKHLSVSLSLQLA
jgi:hypothetical protein